MNEDGRQIIDEELRLLALVLERLAESTPRAAPSERSVVAELTHLRDTLREGVKAEDQAALQLQWERQSALLGHLRGAARPDPVDPGTPYFAHLRLREEGKERDVLLGKTTRMLSGLPIVDWRHAPISRVFYRYRQGDDFEEEIAGRLREGEVVARRTVTVRDGTLRRVDAPEGIFEADTDTPGGWRERSREAPKLAGGQGAALRAHDADASAGRRLGGETRGQRRDRHLPDIASLLDPTQFELVTRPGGGFVVIRGVAGSGKTTVALHRIAYLAYEDARIDSADTLFLVFSPALRRYVSHVLPALRVERVRVLTFDEWAEEHVHRILPQLPKRRRDSLPAVVHRVKTHPALGDVLARQIARTPGRRDWRQVVDDWHAALTDLPLLRTVLQDVAPGAFRPGELEEATDWSRRQHEEVYAWLRHDGGGDSDLDPEDLPLLLRAWQLRMGRLPGRRREPLAYRHIAVDEVQDFSPVEVQVLLGCLDDQQSITLAGDTQQHVVEDGGFTSWSDFLTQLGLAGAEVNTLDVSYRCSREIAEVALAVLGTLREDETPPTTVRSGPPVELFRFTDHGACVAFLAEALEDVVRAEPFASIAVLAPSPALSDLYYEGLQTSEVARVRRVRDQDFAFAPGIEVTEVEQAKGLEFDYVICVEASTQSYPDTPAARRRLHVGMTRAIHQLWLTSVGTPTMLLPRSA